MKKTLLWIVVICTLVWSTFAASPVSSVVQVRTYDAVLGKHASELWQWSASLISPTWVLLTNNHVAQNEDEESAQGFVICMTMQAGKIPECNYTARVIARNSDMDIALLQLDANDIYGNKVNFASLPVMEIDYTYVPKDSDKVQAIGYPGIGGDTMTTTNWTVAGTLDYNGFTYVKTDTTIAPGNSGWPLVTTNGKQVWLNTFGISTVWEWLWYGLLMSEAKSFIDSNIWSKPEASLFDVDIWAYAQKVDTINKSKVLTLPWITYKVPVGYEVKNIISSDYFNQTSVDKKEVQLDDFMMFIFKTPELKDEKTFLYYLESQWIFSKEYDKLIPKTIWWKKFFQLVSSWDDSWGEWGWLNQYIWQLNNQAIVTIILNIENESEKKLPDIKKLKEDTLNSITFTNTNFVPTIDGNIVHPRITISNTNTWVWMSSMLLDLTKYINNLHDSIGVSLSKSSKTTSIKKIYDNDYKDTPKAMKSLGTFQWHQAFIVCNENGNSGFYLDRSSTKVDENNKPLQQFSCTIKAIIPSVNEVPYQINIKIAWPRASKEQFLTNAFSILQKEVAIGNGKTTLPNLFKANVGTKYTDLRDQTVAYKKKIDTLVWYNLLKKTTSFAPYTPITYWLLTEKYLHLVHNISIANSECSTTICMLQKKQIVINDEPVYLYDLFNVVNINWNSYVNVDMVTFFTTFLQLRLAGVALPQYSEEILQEIMNDEDNPEYKEIYDKIDSYNATLYWSKKIDYQEVIDNDYQSYYKSSFKASKVVTYSPKKWITVTSLFKNTPLVFDISKDNPVSCAFGCDIKNQWEFVVLDKWTMIDYLVEKMDFGLFDKELAKRKEADINADGIDSWE